MNINDAFPSNYLRESDLKGREVKVRISHVAEEDVGDGTKPVLYFQGKEKGLVLNKTNAMAVAAAFGPETNGWENGEVIIFPSTTNYKGSTVPCLRVRVAAQPAAGEEEPPF